MHPSKRKRSEDASSALTKPFRTPLIVDPSRKKPSSEKQDDPNIQEHRAIASTRTSSEIQSSYSSPPVPSVTPIPKARPHHYLSSPIRLPSQSRISRHDPEYIALQKQHSALVLQLKDLSTSLDTATQALKIVQSKKDDDLTRLISKWRTASISAAEELFPTAKECVNQMGGVEAWRERYMKPCKEVWDEDELTEEQKAQLDIAREEARIEAERYEIQQQESTPDAKDDDSFTIDMMLKQLNVDLEVIGFDAQSQQWIE